MADPSRIPSELVEKYEGVVITTASKTDPFTDIEFEDICQRFRIKVWKALESYDLSKVKKERPDAKGRTPLDRFVFTCIKNEQKDLIKWYKSKEDSAEPEVLEALVGSASEVYLEADILLPSTLDPMERQVVTLLYLDFDYGEIAGVLNWRRQRVAIFVRRIREKMADWRPTTESDPDGARTDRQHVAA